MGKERKRRTVKEKPIRPDPDETSVHDAAERNAAARHIVLHEDTSCAVIRELLFPYAEGALGEEERKQVDNHLKICPECEKEAKENAALLRTLPLARVKPENDLTEAVMRSVRREKRRPIWKKLGAAAAAFLLVIGTGSVMLTLSGKNSAMESGVGNLVPSALDDRDQISAEKENGKEILYSASGQNTKSSLFDGLLRLFRFSQKQDAVPDQEVMSEDATGGNGQNWKTEQDGDLEDGIYAPSDPKEAAPEPACPVKEETDMPEEECPDQPETTGHAEAEKLPEDISDERTKSVPVLDADLPAWLKQNGFDPADVQSVVVTTVTVAKQIAETAWQIGISMEVTNPDDFSYLFVYPASGWDIVSKEAEKDPWNFYPVSQNGSLVLVLGTGD